MKSEVPGTVRPDRGDGTAPHHNPEVRAHLKFVFWSIFIGVLFMGATGVWAWMTYAPSLEERPPLPPGEPTFTSTPARTP